MTKDYDTVKDEVFFVYEQHGYQAAARYVAICETEGHITARDWENLITDLIIKDSQCPGSPWHS